jgi:hypothetical protein
MAIALRPIRPAEPSAADEAAPQPKTDATRASRHDEWLLDEALRETFPASDPISPAITPAPKAG